MKNRNIALCIILTIVTCGIYGIYWFITMTNEMNELVPDDYQTSGGMAFLLSLVTCGLYTIYWAYKMGLKVNKAQDNPSANNHILMIVFSLFGLGIVNYCLIQAEINKVAVVEG